MREIRMKQKCLIILLIMCSTVVYSIESSVLFSNSNNEVRFSWTSSVHQTYKVLSSTNLLSGFDSTNTIQATPPNNQSVSYTHLTLPTNREE